MELKPDIPATLNRLRNIIESMGYTCEVIDPNELFVFTASTYTDQGEEISININVTANGENHNIGSGNYIAFEVFAPCQVYDSNDELNLCFYIMYLMAQVDMITIQYTPENKQILISRVDCISDELTDTHIINHIIQPTINEFLHTFYLIENNEHDNTQYFDNINPPTSLLN